MTLFSNSLQSQLTQRPGPKCDPRTRACSALLLTAINPAPLRRTAAPATEQTVMTRILFRKNTIEMPLNERNLQ